MSGGQVSENIILVIGSALRNTEFFGVVTNLNLSLPDLFVSGASPISHKKTKIAPQTSRDTS